MLRFLPVSVARDDHRDLGISQDFRGKKKRSALRRAPRNVLQT